MIRYYENLEDFAPTTMTEREQAERMLKKMTVDEILKRGLIRFQTFVHHSGEEQRHAIIEMRSSIPSDIGYEVKIHFKTPTAL